MSNGIRATVMALLLFCPITASAHGWRGGNRGVAAYYYAPPLVEMPIFRVLPVMPCPIEVPVPAPIFQVPVVPVPAPRALAVPTPAPPSSGPIVPTPSGTPPMNRVPAVDESRSFHPPTPAVVETSARPKSATARVGFWNVTGREVVLRVDGKTHALGHGKCLKLDLARTFVWKVGDSEAQVEEMPASVPSMEIVIRR
jgi:hypothetical protein